MDVSNVMMANATNTKQRSNSAETNASAASLNYNTFLKLLLEQMRNQDPTAPMKSTDYMAQLATFSQVEQSMIGNNKLDALLSSSALSQVDSVIGRTVTSADGSISGQVSSVRITNDGAVAKLSTGDEVLIGPGIVIS
ncbi:flagellar hook assembly protein FlgD [Microvirga sp. 17 mud 1-3]|uniref:flagellar hook assembly protein FlgD n=1 Tax=Microvirga sp. 17 mud 1-3 TaxID=2082949 RepID=UPI000D6B6D93|nr:flagellar hook assembly protein FlgD [Microvirga sp. 17 mud 1-3]AWM85896.1 flagellar basal body rod modification protein [Microvirga sp. 17 mud 1-3]